MALFQCARQPAIRIPELAKRGVVDYNQRHVARGSLLAAHGEAHVYRVELEPPDESGVPQVDGERGRHGADRYKRMQQAPRACLQAAPLGPRM